VQGREMEMGAVVCDGDYGKRRRAARVGGEWCSCPGATAPPSAPTQAQVPLRVSRLNFNAAGLRTGLQDYGTELRGRAAVACAGRTVHGGRLRWMAWFLSRVHVAIPDDCFTRRQVYITRPELPTDPIHRHMCTIARLHDCTTARLHGCTAARLHVSIPGRLGAARPWRLVGCQSQCCVGPGRAGCVTHHRAGP
jgi:hypothetical protein